MDAAPQAASRSAAIRARLGHPIIDTDGHAAEFEPLFFDHLAALGGIAMVERFKRSPDIGFHFGWHQLSPAERRAQRAMRPNWWAHPTRNTLDRATSSLPALMHERLDEMGLDFSIIYPSVGLNSPAIWEEDLRRAACRALNNYHAEIFRPYRDRLTPVATIPMHTPVEALDELEHAVRGLGYKAIVMPAYVRRPIPALAARAPELERRLVWFDTFALDSEYDYDPVWAKCLELKVAPTFHCKGTGIGFRNSISNFMYNHIGHFAATAEAICKSLFFGGVTRRFPALRFAFQEGGVGWARVLYGDLIGHFKMHGMHALAQFDPANLDRQLFRALCLQYGGSRFYEKFPKSADEVSDVMWGRPEDPADLDEFALAGITQPADVRERFVPNFFFGCEGDDRVTPWAFDTRRTPLGVKLNAIYGSDIGHRDLADMRNATAEAYELVEEGLITEGDFREFVFVNPVKLHAGMNPDFFKGTVVERAVDELLAGWHAQDGASGEQTVTGASGGMLGARPGSRVK
jgi:predicted TIM-barrel fold metal-dependent hydrolase